MAVALQLGIHSHIVHGSCEFPVLLKHKLRKHTLKIKCLASRACIWSRHCTVGSTNHCIASYIKLLPYTHSSPILCHQFAGDIFFTCNFLLLFLKRFYPETSTKWSLDCCMWTTRWHAGHLKDVFTSCLGSWTPPLLGNAPAAAAACTQAGQAGEHWSKGQAVPTRLFCLYQWFMDIFNFLSYSSAPFAT